MSSITRKYSSSKSSSTKTPFCKVCYDAKQPNYDTHYIRASIEPNAAVVCPYLLSLSCNKCGLKGHTSSYCSNKNIITKNITKNIITKTPFCKVCYDANQPNYDTHYIRESTAPNANVVCPYLLSMKCLNCGLSGHTISYCLLPRGLSQHILPIEKKEEKFNLSENSFPPINNAPNQTGTSVLDWTIISKKAPDAKLLPIPHSLLTINEKKHISQIKNTSPTPTQIKSKPITFSKNWADYSDSDSDSDSNVVAILKIKKKLKYLINNFLF